MNIPIRPNAETAGTETDSVISLDERNTSLSASVNGNSSQEFNVAKTGLVSSLAPAKGFASSMTSSSDRSFHSLLNYFETVMSYGQNADPRATMLMVNAYLNANQQAEGIKFFSTHLEEYSGQLEDDVRAVIKIAGDG